VISLETTRDKCKNYRPVSCNPLSSSLSVLEKCADSTVIHGRLALPNQDRHHILSVVQVDCTDFTAIDSRCEKSSLGGSLLRLGAMKSTLTLQQHAIAYASVQSQSASPPAQFQYVAMAQARADHMASTVYLLACATEVRRQAYQVRSVFLLTSYTHPEFDIHTSLKKLLFLPSCSHA
jgi:hypothetical protein